MSKQVVDTRPDWEELRAALDWGLWKFKEYTDHKMSCTAWGPRGSRFYCSCGLMDAVKKAEELLARCKLG